jgi:hypothetical protein
LEGSVNTLRVRRTVDGADTLHYNREEARLLLSAMHKHVRRSRPLEAMLAAYLLAKMSEVNAWSELRIIAIEDVAQPLEVDTVERMNGIKSPHN